MHLGFFKSKSNNQTLTQKVGRIKCERNKSFLHHLIGDNTLLSKTWNRRLRILFEKERGD